MRRITFGIAGAACISAIALATAGSAGADSQRATDCGYKQFGSTYVYSIRAKQTGCDNARTVAEKFTKCRKRNGGADGRCRHRVRKFRCSENRHDATSVQYSSDVVCKRGAKRVRFVYTQNT
jgi:hypothetical protein